MNINICNMAASAANKAAAFGLGALLMAPGVYADDFPHRGDFGLQVEHLLKAQAEKFFGIGR